MQNKRKVTIRKLLTVVENHQINLLYTRCHPKNRKKTGPPTGGEFSAARSNPWNSRYTELVKGVSRIVVVYLWTNWQSSLRSSVFNVFDGELSQEL